MKAMTLGALAAAGTVALATGANAGTTVVYPPASAYAYYPPGYAYEPQVQVYTPAAPAVEVYAPPVVYSPPVVYGPPVAVYAPPGPVVYEPPVRRLEYRAVYANPEPDYPYAYYWPGNRFSNQNWHGR
jgi:hypothetical protein